MGRFTILYDEPQEADWFRSLNEAFAGAAVESIDSAQNSPPVKPLLVYDRPDIILLDDGKPILVVEETVEVPSGHNVGQRFARIAAAAENGVPCIYFGPYVAKKHGGATAGRRFVNARLFHALDAMERTTKTAVVAIDWPVDKRYEVRRDGAKDQQVREYVREFLKAYRTQGATGISRALVGSQIHKQLVAERDEFVRTRIRNPKQYDGPPDSVEILSKEEFGRRRRTDVKALSRRASVVVLYNIGMTYIRSDPYTGTGMLYRYLYVAEHPERVLVLWFPNISATQWTQAARGGGRKDIRLFRILADAILFSDAFVTKDKL